MCTLSAGIRGMEARSDTGVRGVRAPRAGVSRIRNNRTGVGRLGIGGEERELLGEILDLVAEHRETKREMKQHQEHDEQTEQQVERGWIIDSHPARDPIGRRLKGGEDDQPPSQQESKDGVLIAKPMRPEGAHDHEQQREPQTRDEETRFQRHRTS